MASNAEPSDDTPSRGSAALATYDPRQYQNPHPDDRDDGGAGKSKSKNKAKASKDTSGKAAADGSHCCYHCGTAGAKSCCGGCHRAWYCGHACQKAAWRGHKKACKAAQRAEARRAQRGYTGGSVGYQATSTSTQNCTRVAAGMFPRAGVAAECDTVCSSASCAKEVLKGTSNPDPSCRFDTEAHTRTRVVDWYLARSARSKYTAHPPTKK